MKNFTADFYELMIYSKDYFEDIEYKFVFFILIYIFNEQ